MARSYRYKGRVDRAFEDGKASIRHEIARIIRYVRDEAYEVWNRKFTEANLEGDVLQLEGVDAEALVNAVVLYHLGGQELAERVARDFPVLAEPVALLRGVSDEVGGP